MPSIEKLQDGTYSTRVNHARPGEPRDIRTVRAPTMRALNAELARIRLGRLQGELVATSVITVAEVIDAYLAEALHGRARNTQVSIRNTMRLPREVLGTRQARRVTPDDIRALAEQARTAGRHPQHDEYWTGAARICDLVRHAGPAGTTAGAVAAAMPGWDRPRVYQALRRLRLAGRLRPLSKGWWARPAGDDGTGTTDPASLRPPSRVPGLQADTCRWMISRLSAAFDQAIRDGKLARNPCTGVKVFESREDRIARTAARPLWDDAQIAQFLDVTASHRLACCWRLSAYGLRRGEVVGLRWDDVDLLNGTLTVAQSRVREGADAVVKPPKSDRSYRTLPLDDATRAALEARLTAEQAERDAAGPAWAESGYVAVDERGAPVMPEWYSIEFARICKRAGLTKMRLTDVRHSANSAMAAQGIPAVIRGLWIGNSPSVNEKTYTHPRPSDIAEAARIVHGYMNPAGAE